MDKLSAELNKFVKDVAVQFPLQLALLFGSRSRGDYLSTSDVDIILVSDSFKDIAFIERISLVMKYWDSDLELQPVCFTLEEFIRKQQQIGTVSQAVKEGTVLYHSLLDTTDCVDINDILRERKLV